MKKHRLFISSKKDLKALNKKIAIDTICSWFPDCNKEELEKELDMYI